MLSRDAFTATGHVGSGLAHLHKVITEGSKVRGNVDVDITSLRCHQRPAFPKELRHAAADFLTFGSAQHKAQEEEEAAGNRGLGPPAPTSASCLILKRVSMASWCAVLPIGSS